ncbi:MULTISPECIES: AMP phosphorylase [unclassified Archaeoglobus]|jgi:AMP phosphorylase|uniref:AMP phosphorylase n=1 Tax=unclassified Archaeoglobus TaxID=2643606 RepID=UPI0025C57198|nr:MULTISPECIES: AMP phosphorylase [unclassified Archaeoglobus]
MMLKAIKIPFKSGRFAVILNEDDASELGVREGDRVKIRYGKAHLIATVQLTKEIVGKGYAGLTDLASNELEIVDEANIELFPVQKPKSVELIKKKTRGGKLTQDEIRRIVEDITNNALSEVELTAFVVSSMLRGMDFDEIEWLTRSMIETGERLYFDRGIVVDKHSIGGVPGNKISLIIVPTVAAAGLLIPKTASRAITSASGTADTMEVLADVNLSVDEIKEITERVGGVIAWGGATNIAPADDKIIRVEHPLSIDPRPQLLASVMAKKGSVGAKHAVIDIPVGEGAKIEDADVARSLANDFIELGRRLGLNVTSAITYGGQPIGRTVGPALEAKEALKAMEERKGSSSLLEKSLGIAGILFEMTGVATNGYMHARKIFESGKTLEKFREIVAAQGGDENVGADDIPVGDKIYTLKSTVEGAVVAVSNKSIVKIARTAGAPKDKGAGVYVHKKRGEVVNAGDPLLTIYAEKDWKLDNAIEVAMAERPIVVSGMVLEVYGRRGV